MTPKAKNTTGLGRSTVHLKAPLFLLLTLVILAMTAAPALAALPSSFGERGSGAGELNNPHGIAVSRSGDVFIADHENQRADRFDGEGEFKLAWGEGVADGVSEEPQTCTLTCFEGLQGSGAGEFNLPEGIAVDNSLLGLEDVYVADQGNHRVQKFAPDGSFILMFGGEVNETKDSTPGATEAEKNVCTAASGDICKEGTPGTGNGQFEQVAGSTGSIAVDGEGAVYVGDVERVERFNPKGEYLGQLTLTGAGDVTAVAVDADKDVYVNSSAVVGVREFAPGGTELGLARDASGEPGAITLGAAGELFVDNGQDRGVHSILEYDSAGTQIASFGSEGVGGSNGIAYSESLNVIYVLNPGAVRLVTPPPPGPLVLSQSAEAIEPTSATLGAMVNPEGPAVTDTHFEYGTTTTYGENTTPEALKGGAFENQTVATPITRLQPRTTYHFRVVATNALGETTDGPDQTFTTLPPVLIDGESATQVSARSARLGAELNPLGSATEYHFEFGLSSAYGEEAPVPEASAGSGHGDASVALQLEGLSPGTTYHYRVVAHNSFGAVEGEDRTFTTQGEERTVLPDGRQWEMVSPPDKEGVSLEAIAKEGAVIQAAEDGSSITYVAKAAIEAGSPSNRSLSNTQVLSKRGASGWASRDISTPHETVAILLGGFLSEYKQFANDLSTGIVEPQGSTPLSPQTTERTPYVRQENGEYTPIVTATNVAPGVKFGGTEGEPLNGGVFGGGVEFVDASPDASRVILTSPQNLTPGYEGHGEASLYEWLGGKLRPVSILPNLEAQGAVVGNHLERNMRGAVSGKGDRVVFQSGGHLYVRDMALGKTVQADPTQGGPGGAAGAEFQGANSDASKVLFSDAARLTSDATAAPGQPDLYECEVVVVGTSLSCVLRDLTVDANSRESAHLEGEVSAFSEDGRYVYFAASGVLAPGAVPGNCEEESESATCNLYVRDTVTEQTKLVAELSGEDYPDWGRNSSELNNLTARSSPDGRYFTFMSERPLTGYDNRDAGSAQRDEEVFLYDSSSGSTTCVSCDPTGARPQGILDVDKFPGLLVDRPRTWQNRWLAASIPGWTPYDVNQALYQSRYLSNSGRMFFNSSDALVPQDANGKEDVYEYEPDGIGDCASALGCQNLISSGTSSEESAFMDASADGSDVFFMTAAKLSPADVDSDFDIYDARVCSAGSPCPPQSTTVPPPCTTTDSCRAAPAPQPPIFGSPPSATFNGAGNVASQTPAVKPKSKSLTRAQKLSKALKACKAKRSKRKRQTCEGSARRKYGARAKSKPKSHRGAK